MTHRMRRALPLLYTPHNACACGGHLGVTACVRRGRLRRPRSPGVRHRRGAHPLLAPVPHGDAPRVAGVRALDVALCAALACRLVGGALARADAATLAMCAAVAALQLHPWMRTCEGGPIAAGAQLATQLLARSRSPGREAARAPSLGADRLAQPDDARRVAAARALDGDAQDADHAARAEGVPARVHEPPRAAHRAAAARAERALRGHVLRRGGGLCHPRRHPSLPPPRALFFSRGRPRAPRPAVAVVEEGGDLRWEARARDVEGDGRHAVAAPPHHRVEEALVEREGRHVHAVGPRRSVLACTRGSLPSSSCGAAHPDEARELVARQ